MTSVNAGASPACPAVGGHEPVQVRAPGVQSVEGHHLPGQVEWGEQLLEVARLGRRPGHPVQLTGPFTVIRAEYSAT